MFPAEYTTSLQWLQGLPLYIQIALLVSLFAVLTITLACIGLLCYRLYSAYIDRRNNRLLMQIDERIQDHIIMVEKVPLGARPEVPSASFGQLPLHRRWARKLLVDRILYYRRNFSGHISHMLRELYLSLGLQRQAQQQLHAFSTNRKVLALSELFHMDIHISEDEVLPFSQSRDRYMREMARCYLIKLGTQDPFRFFDEVKEPILQWEQFELFHNTAERRDQQDLQMPSFARWIDPSFHPSVISFSMKLAVHFQQFDAIPVILNFLQNAVQPLRAEAINSLGKLMATEAEPYLLSIYENEDETCKAEILKALGRIGSGQSTGFLEKVFFESTSFQLRKHSMRSLINNKTWLATRANQILDGGKAEDRTFLLYSLNPLIKY